MNQISRLRSKILSFSALENQLKEWRNANEKIVFTNGCFDLVHFGHVDYLAKARDLGNRLVVGLNTDASIRRLKGSSRPVKDEQSRLALLAGMAFVDAAEALSGGGDVWESAHTSRKCHIDTYL